MAQFSAFYRVLYILSVFMIAFSLPVPEEEAQDIERRVTRVGRATFFYPGLGNCGIRSTNADPVVAMSKEFYDRNKGSNCGQWIEIINTATGAKAYGQMLDSCPGCTENQLDLSPSLFQKFAPLSNGIFTAQWHFMQAGWHP